MWYAQCLQPLEFGLKLTLHQACASNARHRYWKCVPTYAHIYYSYEHLCNYTVGVLIILIGVSTHDQVHSQTSHPKANNHLSVPSLRTTTLDFCFLAQIGRAFVTHHLGKQPWPLKIWKSSKSFQLKAHLVITMIHSTLKSQQTYCWYLVLLDGVHLGHYLDDGIWTALSSTVQDSRFPISKVRSWSLQRVDERVDKPHRTDGGKLVGTFASSLPRL